MLCPHLCSPCPGMYHHRKDYNLMDTLGGMSQLSLPFRVSLECPTRILPSLGVSVFHWSLTPCAFHHIPKGYDFFTLHATTINFIGPCAFRHIPKSYYSFTLHDTVNGLFVQSTSL